VGHLGHLKTEYEALVRRLEANPIAYPEPDDEEARRGWKEILEIIFTPEEADLCSRLPVRPSSIKTIAARVGGSPEELESRLNALCDKGVVMDIVHPETGKTRYLLSPPVVGFFEFAFMRAHDMFPKQKLARAMDAYMSGDEAFAREVFGTDTVIGRALVREDQVAEDSVPDVLDWERATALVREARSLAVSLCYCRHKAEHLERDCDAPKEICLSLNDGADFVLRHEFGRPVSVDEGLEILERARSHGLVHIADNVRNRPSYVCNCCSCCCEQLRSVNRYDFRAVNPSGFQPLQGDPKLCKGCTRCARACPVTAIGMKPAQVDRRRKNTLRPEVDLERCLGCGLCAEACPQGAMTMTRSKEQPCVPENRLERALRMALEKGRLPHLLFDEGAGRGHRFLNRALRLLQRLPVTDRILASQQVRSRYLRKMLRAVGSAS
jgi:Pyruvate/2-oxoacid:ferredoxin oxidoreductase delta subunit